MKSIFTKKIIFIGLVAILAAGVLLGILITHPNKDSNVITNTSSITIQTQNKNTEVQGQTSKPALTPQGTAVPTASIEIPTAEPITTTNAGPIMNPNDIIENDPDIGIQIPTTGICE